VHYSEDMICMRQRVAGSGETRDQARRTQSGTRAEEKFPKRSSLQKFPVLRRGLFRPSAGILLAGNFPGFAGNFDRFSGMAHSSDSSISRERGTPLTRLLTSVYGLRVYLRAHISLDSRVALVACFLHDVASQDLLCTRELEREAWPAHPGSRWAKRRARKIDRHYYPMAEIRHPCVRIHCILSRSSFLF
jgi:hypothetical protein